MEKPDPINYKYGLNRPKDYEQLYSYDCGTSCLRSVLAAEGIKISEKALLKKTKPTRKDGTKLKMIIKVAEEYGFDGEYKKRQTIDDLKANINEKYIIVLEDDHYIIILKIKNDILEIEDPANKGLKKMSFDRLRKKWFGKEDDEITTTRGQTIYLTKK